jgi:hypothetical protein
MAAARALGEEVGGGGEAVGGGGDGIARRRRIWWWRWPRALVALSGWMERGDREAGGRREGKEKRRVLLASANHMLLAGTRASAGGARASGAGARARVQATHRR